ncbi:MAG: alpha/beta fold hydrolase [Planctomycetes bacterium]|nr:alpha/beta fold hydrolase [Planctomycetota bacterium]
MDSSRSHRRGRLPTLLAAGLVGIGVWCGPASVAETAAAVVASEATPADSEVDCPGPSDAEPAVWVVSSRRLPGVCRLPADVTFGVERRAAGGRWERADLGLLLAKPLRPLVIFVHGNRYDSCDAKLHGLSLARRLVACLPVGSAPHLVIFSWPSHQQGIALKDGRRKYDRAYADGHYLAWLLGQLEPERPVALVGYSFGALVTAQALEDLASLAPGGMPWTDRPGRTHLVLVAPALRCDAVAPCGPYRETLAGLDRLTLLINSRDKALRFFPLLEPRVNLPAMGLVGMPRRWLPAELDYQATDAAGIVGKLHTLQRYLDSRVLAERIATGALDGLAAD